MLHDYCLSPLTLNPSPPHATIATCLWYGRRSQQYAGKRQDAVLASDSFGFIKCTWVYAVMDASVVGDKHWITYVHPVVATCTVVAILLHDMYPLTASAESCTDPVVSPAPVGSASVVVVHTGRWFVATVGHSHSGYETPFPAPMVKRSVLVLVHLCRSPTYV